MGWAVKELSKAQHHHYTVNAPKSEPRKNWCSEEGIPSHLLALSLCSSGHYQELFSMWTLGSPDRFATVLQLRAGCSGMGAHSLRRTSRRMQPQQYVTVMAHSGTFYSRPIIRSTVSSSVCPITPFAIHHRGRKHLPAQVFNQQHLLINQVLPLLPSVFPG